MNKDDLMHLKIQAAMRENNIPENEIKYIGEGEGTHWYRIADKYSVPVNMIEGFDRVDNE